MHSINELIQITALKLIIIMWTLFTNYLIATLYSETNQINEILHLSAMSEFNLFCLFVCCVLIVLKCMDVAPNQTTMCFHFCNQTIPTSLFNTWSHVCTVAAVILKPDTSGKILCFRDKMTIWNHDQTWTMIDKLTFLWMKHMWSASDIIDSTKMCAHYLSFYLFQKTVW